MRVKAKKHFDKVLSHLYINPLEKCNLRCKICYTRKTVPILTEEEILEFVSRYEKVHKLETITFCGGEVFALPYFPELVNKLTSSKVILVSPEKIGTHPGSPTDSGRTPFARMTKSEGIFVQIITNGTINRLSEFDNPNMVNLIVSLDGLKSYHDQNRGEGNFDKSIKFLRKAKKLGFYTEIFSIVTKQNIQQIDWFEEYLNKAINNSSTIGGVMASAGLRPATPEVSLAITYHPRKPPAYLLHHPISNIFGETDGFDFLTSSEMVKIMKERLTFPPKELGCYQIALVSDGRVFGCCEGTVPIGSINDSVVDLFDKLWQRLEIWDKLNKMKNCLGCSQSEFMCGIKKYLIDLSSRA